MSGAHGARPRWAPILPENIVYKVFQYLPTTSLFTVSLVCSCWRKFIYSSGPPSQALLKPHLAILRERFGATEVPHKLPIPTVRKLLVLYARQDLFGAYASTVTYDVSDLCSTAIWKDSCPIPLQRRRFAVCGSLVVFAERNKRVHIFETNWQPARLLATIKIPARPIGLAVSESFLAVLDEKRVHMYHLLARNTANFMPIHIYSIEIPHLQNPSAIALTPEGNTAPLVAVLGTELYLIHPSHALSQKRGGFFREDPGEKETASEKSPQKMPANDRLTHDTTRSRLLEWILIAAGSSIGISFPISFNMRGRQLVVSTIGPQNHSSQRSAYLGSSWASEDPHELARRRTYGLKDGQDLVGKSHDADALFRHYCARTAKRTGSRVRRWMPKHLDTAETEIEDAVHIQDSYYMVTESGTGCVRIVTVAPFVPRFLLYRRNKSFEERSRQHCGYTVFRGFKTTKGTRIRGYIAFSPSEGRLNVLPLQKIPWPHDGERHEDVGWELVRECRDIAIGGGEILSMFAGDSRVTIMFEHRIVVVRLWTEKVGGVEDERNGWAIDRNGSVHENWDGPGKLRCLGIESGACDIM